MQIKYIIIVLMISVIFQACSKSDEMGNSKNNNLIPVFIEEVVGRKFNISIESIGRIDSRKKAMLVFESAGQLEEIFYQVGDIIKKGEVIAKIESSIYEAAYELAKISFEKATQDFMSAEKLLHDLAISNDEFDLLNIALVNAKYNLIQAKERFDKCSLIAPFDGTIMDVNLKIGEYVFLGNKLVSSVTLADMNDLIIDVSIPESQIKDVAVGNDVIVNIMSVSNDEMKGVVSSVGLMNNMGSNNYKVEISLVEFMADYKLGMIASTSIFLKKHDNVIVIPKKIILDDKKGDYVFIKKNGIALKRYVSILSNKGSNVMVEGELELGDSLVTQGYRKISIGKRLLVKN